VAAGETLLAAAADRTAGVQAASLALDLAGAEQPHCIPTQQSPQLRLLALKVGIKTYRANRKPTHSYRQRTQREHALIVQESLGS
jgi:hypothetical protein